MTISEMHTYFRQYAQQMGMQNVRAILPEQIDMLLNTSISDTINEIIKENIGTTSDRVVTDNSKIGSINALRSLYEIKEIPFNEIFNEGDNNGHIVHLISDLQYLTNAGLLKDNTVDTVTTYSANYLFLVDFSIRYKREIDGDAHSNFITNYFPVRIIDDIYLADVLNDFILAPRFRSPIITISSYGQNDKTKGEIPVFNLYIDKGIYTDRDNVVLNNGLKPDCLRISLVSKPNTVVFNDDNEGVSVDCNLPEYMHIDIIKHAVDLYRVALQGSLYSAQQAQQLQQRENVRNNARNDN